MTGGRDQETVQGVIYWLFSVHLYLSIMWEGQVDDFCFLRGCWDFALERRSSHVGPSQSPPKPVFIYGLVILGTTRHQLGKCPSSEPQETPTVQPTGLGSHRAENQKNWSVTTLMYLTIQGTPWLIHIRAQTAIQYDPP